MTGQPDKNAFAERVSLLAKRLGGGAELARQTGISQSTLSRIIRGKDAHFSNILKLCEYCKRIHESLEWLLFGQGQARNREAAEHTLSGSVELPIYNTSPALEDRFPIHFEKHWFLNRISRHPEHCFATQAGDSEIRCIERGSWVIVDQSLSQGDGLYFIAIHEATMIRRLQFLPTGEVNVRTNGEAYKNYMLDQAQLANLKVIGRVVWWEGNA